MRRRPKLTPQQRAAQRQRAAAAGLRDQLAADAADNGQVLHGTHPVNPPHQPDPWGDNRRCTCGHQTDTPAQLADHLENP